MSLNIVKTFFAEHPGVKFGLMSHALVSESFRTLYSQFPCAPSDCWLGTREASVGCNCDPEAAHALRDAVIKAVDCGIFSRTRALDYPKLFEIYERMGADLGIMKDVFGDARRTVESAKRAVDQYQRRSRTFDLMLVAQGSTLDEYLWCMDRLVQLGVGRIAVGGLLNRKVNSARYSSAAKLKDIDNILSTLKSAHPDRELFVLGCYHPKRHSLFSSRSVFGSDYKGWIFNYEHRIDRLDTIHSRLMAVEGELRTSKEITKLAWLRHDLAAILSSVRRAYATTKNESRAKSTLKARHRQKLAALMQKIREADDTLVQLRTREATLRDLPVEYSILVSEFAETLGLTDQETRVTGVHAYLTRHVLPLMRGSATQQKLSGNLGDAAKVNHSRTVLLEA